MQGNISYAKKYIKLDDNDHFNLTSEGNLEFKYYPDFENPSDKDKNNTYYVAVYAEGYEDPNDIVIQPINITITDQKVEDKTKPTVTAVQTNNLINNFNWTYKETESNFEFGTLNVNEAVDWSLEGPDASYFGIESKGNKAFLKWQLGPDYENPKDSGGLLKIINIYLMLRQLMLVVISN